jgi:L-malate glycosyltransferase
VLLLGSFLGELFTIMKHILYVLPYMNLGGTEKQAFSLMDNLQQHYHISLLAPDGSGAAPFRQAGFHYYEFERLDQSLVAGLWQFRQSLLAIHRDRPIDLVHVHGAHELMGLVRILLPRVPIVFTVHGYHGSSSALSYRLAAIFGNLLADQVIVVSRSELKTLSEYHLQTDKTTLVYNGVAEPKIDRARTKQLSQQFGLDSPEQVVIGTAARLSEAKGLEYLIAAMPQLIKQHPHIKLVIAGDGELKDSLQQMVQNLYIENHVVFAGYVRDVHNLIYSFDIFVLPSLQEALPLASAEAMSMGKPIVGTNIGGIPEQVVDGKTGFIVPPKDPQALAVSIDRLIANPTMLADFGRQGYEYYQGKFALPKMLKDTINVYEKWLC